MFSLDDSNKEIKDDSSKCQVEVICKSDDMEEKDGHLSNAKVPGPRGIVVDGFGAITVCCQTVQSIKRIDPKTKMVSSLNTPKHLGCIQSSLSRNGTIYITFNAKGTIYCIYRNLECKLIYEFDGSNTRADMRVTIQDPIGTVVDNREKYLYVADYCNHSIKRLDISNPKNIELICGKPGGRGSKDGVGEEAEFYYPFAIAKNNSCTLLYVSDLINSSIRAINLQTKSVKTIFSNLYHPHGLVVDKFDNLFICDCGNSRIVKYSITESQATIIQSGKSACFGKK